MGGSVINFVLRFDHEVMSSDSLALHAPAPAADADPAQHAPGVGDAALVRDTTLIHLPLHGTDRESRYGPRAVGKQSDTSTGYLCSHIEAEGQSPGEAPAGNRSAGPGKPALHASSYCGQATGFFTGL